MSRYKMSNQIFSLGLDVQEISVYTYLCSIRSEQSTITGADTVKVKQSTIAQNCSIKAVQTVAKIIARLTDKGLVEPLKRSVKANHHKGTYIYAVKKLPADSSYFLVDRHIFGKLVPRQMMVYLFICKSYSIVLQDSWNSYNDIAAQIGMKRELVIQTVNELVQMHYIVRCRRRSRENNKVYVDNHYQVIFFVQGRIRKKSIKMVQLHAQYNRTGQLVKSYQTQLHDTTSERKCQEVFQNFLCRGSP